MEGELAEKTTFDNQPLEMDWENAVVTKEHYEIPLHYPLNGFVSKYQEVETRLLVPRSKIGEYSFMTLDTEEIREEFSFTELTSVPDKTSLEAYLYMSFNKEFQPGDLHFKRLALSDPKAYMPVECETVTIRYLEKDCYWIGGTLYTCSDWREVSRQEVKVCGNEGIIGGRNYHKVFEIESKQLDSCINNILIELTTLDSGPGTIVSSFSQQSGGFNWTLKSGNTGLSNASTSPFYNNGVTTTISNTNLSNATNLSIVRTILHEAVHAYFVTVQNLTLTVEEKSKLMGNNWFSIVQELVPNQGHALIASNFADQIAKGLYDYSQLKGLNISMQYCKDLSWGGLTHYDSNGSGNYTISPWFVENFLNSSDRSRILNVINVEQIGGSNKKGDDAGC
ncbi:hypothetical protein PBT90_18965 [Algoriphagus halophytocola]|uniref:hypothetical protein n=1 Tax=Algoriphagus halophytocola TaxID=2991499 RepID=UPI0022DDA409|nr:hypothetical protein [Algoriphagus sp. TR-M9]WBL42808.1 hypothetical protein PBT90_18965 [Algoriphagus sp. TR-M9]